MELTDDDVRDFIEGWKEDFGETLDLETGRAEMRRLLDFFITMEELLQNGGDPDKPVDEADTNL